MDRKDIKKQITIGLARMHLEPGERRDFLPDFIAWLEKYGANVVLESGYGSGMGFVEEDYLKGASEIRFASSQEVYKQDYVLVLRYPDDEYVQKMRPDSCLISMLHYPTRPTRTTFLKSLGISAISLDSIKDDSGRRLVENLDAVAWNGVNAAFQVLQSTYPKPGFNSANRPPIQVTLMGAGAVGSRVMKAAINYGDEKQRKSMASAGIAGIQLMVIDYDITSHEEIMKKILSNTDLLIDATQRPDPSQPVIPNEWVGYLPEHAVILDLSVDPYFCDVNPLSVKGVEGIPQGDLDQYIFAPDDPEFDKIPDCFPTINRRFTVSCYSWPGVHPEACMDHYGQQIFPIMRVLIEKGGVNKIRPEGSYFERAIARGLLARWPTDGHAQQTLGKKK